MSQDLHSRIMKSQRRIRKITSCFTGVSLRVYLCLKLHLCADTQSYTSVFHYDVGRFSPFLYSTQSLRVSRGTAVLFSKTFDTRWGLAGHPHAPAASTPVERPGTHCTGGWLGPRAGLDGRKNFVPTGIRSRTVPPVVSSLRCY